MARALLGALIVAIIAGAIGYEWSLKQQALLAQQHHQITDLGQQLNRAQDDNLRLRSQLAKLQEEENRLAAENNALNEAIAKSRLTGKPPAKISLPYPPK